MGVAFRLTNVASAIACAQVERRQEIIERRENFFKRYNNNLRDIPGILLRPVMTWAKLSPWVFPIRVDENLFGKNRDQLANELLKKGIETRPLYIPLPYLPPYRQENIIEENLREMFHNSFKLSYDAMYLPSSTDITDDAIDEVCDAIKNCSA